MPVGTNDSNINERGFPLSIRHGRREPPTRNGRLSIGVHGLRPSGRGFESHRRYSITTRRCSAVEHSEPLVITSSARLFRSRGRVTRVERRRSTRRSSPSLGTGPSSLDFPENTLDCRSGVHRQRPPGLAGSNPASWTLDVRVRSAPQPRRVRCFNKPGKSTMGECYGEPTPSSPSNSMMSR